MASLPLTLHLRLNKGGRWDFQHFCSCVQFGTRSIHRITCKCILCLFNSSVWHTKTRSRKQFHNWGPEKRSNGSQRSAAPIYPSGMEPWADLSAGVTGRTDTRVITWKCHIWPIPAYEPAGIYKCSSWRRSSLTLTCPALKYSCFWGSTHWSQTLRRETRERN